MKIEKDFRNDLLKRREINAIINAKSNPGYEQTKKDIASHFKVNEDSIIIKNINSSFGSSSFFLEALIYDSLDDQKRIELKLKPKKEVVANK